MSVHLCSCYLSLCLSICVAVYLSLSLSLSLFPSIEVSLYTCKALEGRTKHAPQREREREREAASAGTPINLVAPNEADTGLFLNVDFQFVSLQFVPRVSYACGEARNLQRRIDRGASLYPPLSLTRSLSLALSVSLFLSLSCSLSLI